MLLAYEMEFVGTEADMYGLFPTMLIIHGVPSELVEVHAMAVNLSKSYLANMMNIMYIIILYIMLLQ